MYTPVSSSVMARLRALSPQSTISETNWLVSRRRCVVTLSMRYMSFKAMRGCRAMMSENASLERLKTTLWMSARHVAERGALSKMDISPKKSPGANWAICCSAPSGRLMLMATFPSARMYSSVPGSPSRKRVCPSASSTEVRCAVTRSTSSRDRREKTLTRSRKAGAIASISRSLPPGGLLPAPGCRRLPGPSASFQSPRRSGSSRQWRNQATCRPRRLREARPRPRR